MSPLISIIIPVYNGEKYISKCLDSLIGQTLTDWECICVDDGSKDMTGAILDEYACKDHRIKIVHKINEGVSIARNTALSMAKGEWVAFSDADDYYFPEGLKSLYDVAVKTGERIVLGNAVQIQVSGKTLQRYPELKEIEVIDRFPKGSLEMWADLFHRDIFLKDKFLFQPGLAYLEDRYLMLQILSKIGKYAVCPSVVYGHYKNPDSVMESKNGLRMAKHCFWAAREMRNLSDHATYFHDEIIENYNQACIRACTYFRKSQNAPLKDLMSAYRLYFSDTRIWSFIFKSIYHEKVRLLKRSVKKIVKK